MDDLSSYDLLSEFMKRADDYEKEQMKKFAIEELEKIKAEMEVIHNRYKINIQGYSMSVAKECIEIIDNHIKELKAGDSDA